MKNIGYSCLLCFLVAYSSASAEEASNSVIYLQSGDMQTLHAAPGSAIKIANGRVLGFKDQGTQITLFAKKQGESLVHVGTKFHRVIVLNPSQYKFLTEAEKQLSHTKGFWFEVVEKFIHLKGKLHRVSDWEQISRLADKTGVEYSFNLSVDPDIREEAQKLLTDRLLKQGLSPVIFAWEPSLSVYLAQKIKSQKKDYNTVLKPFGLKVELRNNQIALAPTVQVEVVMAELIERVDREFGLEWSPFGEFQVLPQASLQTSLTSTLKAMEKRGLGKILATPRILCRSGSEAEFHSGGEFPIPVTEYQSHYKSQNIVWKKHGIVLKFKPLADHHGRLSLKVYAELSVLSDQQTGGVPALMINKIESEFDLSSPRTVALSGLIRQDWHRGRSGLPWLSQIPVLSSLFSSQSYLNKKSELVVFVTPKIISETSESKRSPSMPTGWTRDSF